ncbi:MAG TPA: metal-sensitive transcriptional regulator [Candidatus Eisenbacteria bacterium]|nr:metal-sensitive transcriptional regulator [Candidatus Eisenbacteria bacterium]
MATGSAEASIPASALRHPAQIEARLRRVEWQVRGIRQMYEEGRPCLEILDQLSATRTALGAVALLVIEDHVTGCFEPAAGLELDEARATRLLTAIARAARHRGRAEWLVPNR